jgi:hypothetical protein
MVCNEMGKFENKRRLIFVISLGYQPIRLEH